LLLSKLLIPLLAPLLLLLLQQQLLLLLLLLLCSKWLPLLQLLLLPLLSQQLMMLLLLLLLSALPAQLPLSFPLWLHALLLLQPPPLPLSRLLLLLLLWLLLLLLHHQQLLLLQVLHHLAQSCWIRLCCRLVTRLSCLVEMQLTLRSLKMLERYLLLLLLNTASAQLRLLLPCHVRVRFLLLQLLFNSWWCVLALLEFRGCCI
jgi:hypothetical protein